jgi:hypothetical protein
MIIDAHMHYADDDPEFLALLAEYDLKFMNICVVSLPPMTWREQAELYGEMTSRFPNRFAWCTSFDLPDFVNPDYHDEVIATLDKDFANGAIACKVWKNVGMELRKPDGSFAMPDDPIFDPIYEHIAALNKTLLTHIAEPIACWQPLTGDNPHMTYYRDNPEWHMYNRPEYPSHAQLIAARDNILAKHPKLRMVGAHFGSLEYDVDEVAARLEQYPNFAVDISARLVDLFCQPTSKVRDFMLRYADRVLYGTDIVMRDRPSRMTPEDRATAMSRLREVFDTHFAYFNTADQVSYRGREVEGVNLPADVLQQFYVDTARAWYPGI